MKTLNPATNEVVSELCESTNIHEVFLGASKAFTEWSKQSLDDRFKILKKYESLLIKNRASLAEMISKEVGKPLWESINEVDAMAAKIPISYDAYKLRCPTIENNHSFTRHKPRGITAILGPFNFPGHLPNGHIVPALLAGNCVIFKPSEFAIGVGKKITDLLEQAGIPKGVFQLLIGGKDVGRQISEHPLLDALFFTGSSDTGLHLLEHFSKSPEKLLALEMGGNNPLIVGNIQDFEAASYLIAQSAFLTSGQRCTSLRRLIVQKKDLKLIPILKDIIDSIKLGPFTDQPEPFMGPLISQKAVQTLLSTQEQWIAQGAKPLIKAINPTTNFVTCGLIDTTMMIKRPDVEVFGPLLQLIIVKDFDEALTVANSTRYGLSSALLSDDDTQWNRFYQEIRAGIINRNSPTNGASSLNPFGGLGLSGNGRPSALYAADYCSYPVASMELARLEKPKQLPPGFIPLA